MELAVEAAQSRHLPDFLEQFALRSTRMLDALWGGVAVCRGRETELHAMPGGAATTEAVANWLISCARGSQNDVETLAIPKEIAAALPIPGEPGTVVFVRIAASDNERLGTLNWSGPSGSGWKISMRSAITSWCMTARGKSFERIGHLHRILACRRWRWLARL